MEKQKCTILSVFLDFSTFPQGYPRGKREKQTAYLRKSEKNHLVYEKLWRFEVFFSLLCVKYHWTNYRDIYKNAIDMRFLKKLNKRKKFSTPVEMLVE